MCIRDSYTYMWLSQGDPFRFFDEDIGMKLRQWDMMELHAILEHRKKVGYNTCLLYTSGSNLTQAYGLGGFGIKSVNEQTGEQEYTPIRFSSSWRCV